MSSLPDATPPKRRRRLQYSLRAMLLLTLVVSVLLAVWSAYVAPYRAQRRAVDALEKIGARVEFRPAGPEWARKLLGDDELIEVAEVHLEGHQFKDRDLAPLEKLTGLRRLYLANTPTGDEGLRHVRHLKHLDRMSLWRTKVTDRGVAHLRDLAKLTVLDIHSTQITDAAMPDLGRLEGLTYLDAHGAQITDAALESLAGLEDLRYLSLARNRITGSGLGHLAGLDRLWLLGLEDNAVDDRGLSLLVGLKSLKVLSLSGNPVTAAGLPQLRKLRGLEQVDLMRTQVTFADLARAFGTQVERVEVRYGAYPGSTGAALVRLGGDWPVTFFCEIRPSEADFAHLREMPRLKSLAVHGLKAPDMLLAQVATVAGRLEVLDLSESLVTDAGLLRLGPMGNLRHLDLGHTKVTGPGLAALARCEKLETLNLVDAKVTGPGLAYLKDAQGLVCVELNEESLTAEGVTHLKALKRLKRVAVDSIPDNVARLQEVLPDCEIGDWTYEFDTFKPIAGSRITNVTVRPLAPPTP